MKRNCRRAAELLAQDLRGRMAPDDGAWLAEHLQECAACRQAEADQRAAERLLAAWPHVPHDPERVVVAIRATIERDRAGGTPRSWLRPILIFAVAVVVVGVALLAVPRGRSPAPPVPVPGTSRPAVIATASSGTGRVVGPAAAPAPSLNARRESVSGGGGGGSRTARLSEPRSVRHTRQATPAPPVAPARDDDAGAAGCTAAVVSPEKADELERFFRLPPPDDPSASLFVVAPTGSGAATPAQGAQGLVEAMWERIALAGEARQEELREMQQEPPFPPPPAYEAEPPRPLVSRLIDKGGWG